MASAPAAAFPTRYIQKHENGLSRYRKAVQGAKREAEGGDHHAAGAMLIVAQAERLASIMALCDEDSDDGGEDVNMSSSNDESSGTARVADRIMARRYMDTVVIGQMRSDPDVVSVRSKVDEQMEDELMRMISPQGENHSSARVPPQGSRSPLSVARCNALMRNDDMDSNIDLFFEEYPECSKSDAEMKADNSEDDDTSDGDSSVGQSTNGFNSASGSDVEMETEKKKSKRKNEVPEKKARKENKENAHSDTIIIDDGDDDGKDGQQDAGTGVGGNQTRTKKVFNPYSGSSSNNAPGSAKVSDIESTSLVGSSTDQRREVVDLYGKEQANQNLNSFRYSQTQSDSSQRSQNTVPHHNTKNGISSHANASRNQGNKGSNSDNTAAWDEYHHAPQNMRRQTSGGLARYNSSDNSYGISGNARSNTNVSANNTGGQSSWDNSSYPAPSPAAAAAMNSFQSASEFATNSKRDGSGGGDSWGDSRDSYRGYRAPPEQDTYHQEATSSAPSAYTVPASLQRKYQPPKKNQKSQRQGHGNSATRDTGENKDNESKEGDGRYPTLRQGKGGVAMRTKKGGDEDDEDLPEELQHLDKELVKKIQNEIMESGDRVTFDDIAGLEDAKQTVQEVVCWPMKRPDLFVGLRQAPNGLLLYGPPGTGKTLIGKAIAHESGATFFSISSSSLTSKWIGEGEKLVRTLFAVAAYRQPAVVFIDEIDSLLTQRKSTENEASRRIKTEFLVQLDGTGTTGQGRVLIIGATNRPQELDEAARRRFVKRLYIPLPDERDREMLLVVLLGKANNDHNLSKEHVQKLARKTAGFSGADLKALCTDAAMGPIRELGASALAVNANDVPAISFKHFRRSLKGMRPSVAESDLEQYIEWDNLYGSKRAAIGESGSMDDDDGDSDSSDDEA